MDLVSVYPFAYGERIYFEGMQCVVQSISTSGTVCLGNDLRSEPIARANMSELDTVETGQVTPRCLFHPKLDRAPVLGDFVTIKSEFVCLVGFVPAKPGRVGVVIRVNRDGIYVRDSHRHTVLFQKVPQVVEVLDLPRAMTLPRVRIPDEALTQFNCRPAIIIDTENDWGGIAVITMNGTAFFHEVDELHPFISGRHQAFTILYPTSTVKPDFRVL